MAFPYLVIEFKFGIGGGEAIEFDANGPEDKMESFCNLALLSSF